MPTRSVPFAIKDAVAQEIQRLESVRILKKVEFSRWATPVVPVPKRDGSFRICGDFKVTLNLALEVDQHPIPKPEDIFASLAGGELFTTLDLSQAYQQLLLDEVFGVGHGEHSSGVVPLQPVTLWGCLCPCNRPEDNGSAVKWPDRSEMLPR